MNTPDQESVSDEMLMALADDELDNVTAEGIRARIDQNPDLAARYAVFAETSMTLRAAFAQGDVPERLVAAVRTAPIGEGRLHGQNGPSVVPLRRRAAWPLALAASLAIGVGFGWLLQGELGPTAPMSLDEAAKALSDVPTGQAREVTGFGSARVLGSFETEHGLCRLISVQPSQSAPGRFLACRDGSEWTVALSVADGPRQGFSPASDVATEMLDMYLDTIGAGPALDAQSETDALK